MNLCPKQPMFVLTWLARKVAYTGIGQATGNVLAGEVWLHFGATVLFRGAAVMVSVSMMAFLLLLWSRMDPSRLTNNRNSGEESNGSPGVCCDQQPNDESKRVSAKQS